MGAARAAQEQETGASTSSGRLGRLVAGARTVPPIVAGRARVLVGLLVVVLLAGIGALVYATGGTQFAYLHALYVPIIIAAGGFSLAGGVITAIAATLIVGPWMPLDVATGQPQPLEGWLFRGVFFVVAGLLAGAGTRRLLGRIDDADRALSLERELRVSEHARQKLAEQVLADGGRERSRLALLLHDEIVPHFVAARLQLEIASSRIGDVGPDVAEHLTRSRDALDAGVEELRDVLSRLSSSVLEPGTLSEAVRDAVGDLGRRDGLAVTVDDDELGPVPLSVEILAYEVVRGALSNITRHAGASRALVRLQHRGDVLLVEVTDDGSGFDPASVLPGHGLALLRQRLALVEGALEIDSTSGAGTTVRARIPR